jgi:hypothetical protein
MGGSSSLDKRFIKGGVEHYRLPVMTRDKVLEDHQKTSRIEKFGRIDTPKKSDDIVVISAREKNNANQTGYLVALERILANDIDRHLVGFIEKKISESAESNWKVKKTENSVRVYLNGQRPAGLYNVISTLPLKVEVKSKKDSDTAFMELSIVNPQLENVVESYYTREVAYKKYTIIEAEGDKKDQPEEGDACESDGKKGTLSKEGDSLVCMVKESVNLSFREEAGEGDACEGDGGKKGTMKMVNGALACVIMDSQNKESVIFTVPPIKNEAEMQPGGTDAASPAVGDPCDYQGQQGKLALVNGALICSIGGEKPAGADGAN